MESNQHPLFFRQVLKATSATVPNNSRRFVMPGTPLLGHGPKSVKILEERSCHFQSQSDFHLCPLRYDDLTFGAQGGSRTHKTRVLSAIRMPIPSHGHDLTWRIVRDSNSRPAFARLPFQSNVFSHSTNYPNSLGSFHPCQLVCVANQCSA